MQLRVRCVEAQGALLAPKLQDLVQQKEICQQRAQVDRRVQVVDQLRADGWLARTSSMRRQRTLRHRAPLREMKRVPMRFFAAGLRDAREGGYGARRQEVADLAHRSRPADPGRHTPA